jgi:uracil-DNA glycosylase
MSLQSSIPSTWQTALQDQFSQPYWAALEQFVAAERSQHQVFPDPEDVFSALGYCAPSEVKVLLLGQDPYHDDNQAHGLSFSVRPGIKIPPSLRNMYKELHSDLGIAPVKHGFLEHWAKQGVLLLNAVLTVRAHQANSHKNQGWERLTDAIIRVVNAQPQQVVVILWGAYAQKKAKLIDERHVVLLGVHPSPLSASNGFFGSQPFSKTNAALVAAGHSPIDWALPQDVA